MKAIKSVKQVFEDRGHNVIITKIMQGNGGSVRIDARTRHHVADADNSFSEWVSEKYANRLATENYGRKLSEFNSYTY